MVKKNILLQFVMGRNNILTGLKVALDELVIVHRLTQNTRNTVMLDTEANHSNAKSSDNCINCRAVAEFQTVFSNIIVI